VFWHFAAFTAQHRHTMLAVYAMLPMSMVIEGDKTRRSAISARMWF